jgi:hypothetical protein
MSKRSSLNSNRLIAAASTERHLQAKNAGKHHQPYLRERQAFFTADAVSVFVGERTQYAFSWREVSLVALAQARGGAPVLLIANQTR